MQVRLIPPLACGLSTAYPGAALLIPFQVLLYRRDFSASDWRVLFRILSSLAYILTSGMSFYAVTTHKRHIKSIVLSIQAISMCILTLGLTTYTILFGLSEASVAVNQDSAMSAAELETLSSTCETQDRVAQWAACLYIVGLGMILCTGAWTLTSLLGDIEGEKQVMRTASMVNLPKSFPEIETFRESDQDHPPPIISLFKRIKADKKVSQTNASDRSYEMTGAIPHFPSSSSAHRVSRLPTTLKQ